MFKFVNLPDKFGKTALHYAAKNKNLQNCKLLLSLGASLYTRDYK